MCSTSPAPRVNWVKRSYACVGAPSFSSEPAGAPGATTRSLLGVCDLQREIYSTHNVWCRDVLFDTAERAPAAVAAAPGAVILAGKQAGVFLAVVHVAAALCVLTRVAKTAARARVTLSDNKNRGGRLVRLNISGSSNARAAADAPCPPTWHSLSSSWGACSTMKNRCSCRESNTVLQFRNQNLRGGTWRTRIQSSCTFCSSCIQSPRASRCCSRK